MDTTISSLTLDVSDPARSLSFYETAFGVDSQIRARTADTPATGFRGFTIPLVVGQPPTVDSLLEPALAGGATTSKAGEKGMWGVGAAVKFADSGSRKRGT